MIETQTENNAGNGIVRTRGNYINEVGFSYNGETLSLDDVNSGSYYDYIEWVEGVAK